MAAGKSWCATELQWHNYHRYALAGKLKAICYELYGVADKNDRSRKILQEVGIDLRKHDPDVWIKYLLNTIKNKNEKDKVVVDDLRFINEAKYFRANGFVLIKVTVDEQVRQDRLQDLYPNMDPTRQTHQSEMEWQEIEPDFTVDSTTADAAVQIERILDDVTLSSRR